jgi:YHS domain-containing protein
MSLSRRALLAALPLTLALPRIAFAKEAAIYSDGHVAVDGSDVVAYFKEKKPVKGKADITHDWMGATWQFSSTANRDAFAADPEAYAPQFGGYCAYAVSEGYTASTVPEAWSIVDGKLYLNYSKRVRRIWERDMPGHIAKGNANWPGVLG